MKIKYIIILSIIISLVFLIYLITIDKKIYYLSLGDYMSVGLTSENENKGYSEMLHKYLKENNILEIYINDFSNKSSRTTDLIKDIEDNKSIKINNQNKTLKNALVKADIITLAIGNNDIKDKLTYSTGNELYKYSDEMLEDLEKLFKLIRQYCKEDIYFIGLYNPYNLDFDELFNYINNSSKELCEKYDIIYIDTYNLFSNNKTYIDVYPTTTGYQAIFDILKRQISKKI